MASFAQFSVGNVYTVETLVTAMAKGPLNVS